MDDVSLTLPNGRVVKRQFAPGTSDADVSAAFMPDYRAAGFKSPGAVIQKAYNPVPPQMQGELTAYHPTLGDRFTSYLSGGLKKLGFDNFEANRLGGRWMSALNDLTPVGNITMAADAGTDIRNGHWLRGAGLGALAVIPGAVEKPLARVGKGMFGSGIRAWHGSPHDFDRFDLSKIGTGEGAQAYGHGLYFAENKGVAEDYRKLLSGGVLKRGDGSLLDPAMVEDRSEALVAKYLVRHGKPEAARAALLADYVGPNQQRQLSNKLDEMLAAGVTPAGSGRLYEVNINAKPEDFLDWDAPMWRQPEAVQRLMRARGDFRERPNLEISQTPSGRFTLRNVWGEAAGTFKTRDAAEAKANDLAESWGSNGGMLAYSRLGGNSIYSSLDKGEASKALREAGAPGTRYLDQGSRGAGNGTRNYVVFDDSLVDILNKY